VTLAGAITAVAAHRTGQRLAIATETPDLEDGELIVWNTETGAQVTRVTIENGAGWQGDRGLLRWAHHGERLAVAAATNMIVTLDGAEFIGDIGLDPTRDTPVLFCWVGDPDQREGHQLYAATWLRDGVEGALVASDAGPVERADAIEVDTGPSNGDFRALAWHERTRTVLGLEDDHLCGIDVSTRSLRYRAPLAPARPTRGGGGPITRAFSPDGRWLGVAGVGGVGVFDGATGAFRGMRALEPPIDAISWSRDGALAVVYGPDFRAPAHLKVFHGDGVTFTVDAAIQRHPFALTDVHNLAWSPDGASIALILQDGSIALYDARTGSVRTRLDGVFPASGAGQSDRPGILWVSPHRLIAATERELCFLNTDGTVIARHIAA